MNTIKRFRFNNAGFTLLEVLIAIVVLAVSFIILTPIFITSSNQISYVIHRNDAVRIADNLIVQAQRHLINHQDMDTWDSTGLIYEGEFPYSYQTNTASLNSSETLMEMVVTVQWENGRGGEIRRYAYIQAY